MSAPLTEDVLVLHLENLRLGLESTLATKADLKATTSRVAAIEAGELTRGMKLSIIETVRSNVSTALQQKWVVLNSKAGVAYIMIALCSLSVASYAAFLHG